MYFPAAVTRWYQSRYHSADDGQESNFETVDLLPIFPTKDLLCAKPSQGYAQEIVEKAKKLKGGGYHTSTLPIFALCPLPSPTSRRVSCIQILFLILLLFHVLISLTSPALRITLIYQTRESVAQSRLHAAILNLPATTHHRHRISSSRRWPPWVPLHISN